MVRILYFSLLREKIGITEEELEFEGRVGELRRLLIEKYPQASTIIESVKFAVNEEYVDDDFIISEGDRIALIPPVSGG